MANDREQTNDPQELTVETICSNTEEDDLKLMLRLPSNPLHQPVVVHHNTSQSPVFYYFLHPENPSPSLGIGPLIENPSPSPGIGPPIENPSPSLGIGLPIENPSPSHGIGPLIENPSPSLGFGPLVENPSPSLGFGLLVENPSPSHGIGPLIENPSPSHGIGPLIENPSSSLGSGPLVENPSPNLFSPRPKPKPKKSNLGCQGPYVAMRRRRSNTKRGLRPDKSPTVVPPYPWATDQRATVHSLEELESRGIETVVGDIRCNKCERTFEVGFDLKAESSKLRSFMAEKRDSLSDRSAPEWDTPAWLDCTHCGGKKCAKGVVAEKKRDINWLFLFLGGFLCNCTLQQLKYFCKHTKNHRTGAKNRVLFLTYLGLCKQLDPSGPFDPPCL